MRDVEVPKWLQGLPFAPEFRPTDTEFADPIAYISKIEKEASAFGICKVIPPLPKPSKKYVLHNLNRTLSKCPELDSDVDTGSLTNSENGGGEVRAVFTTRHQELGMSGKRVKGEVECHSMGGPRQVWQSGETYTLEQFETKSKTFAKSQLSVVKEVSPLVIEAMFWKATSEKPIYVEYANDVPGSGFGEPEESFRYFRRHRRRRRKRGTFDRNNRESSGSKNDQGEDNNSTVDKDLEVTKSSRLVSFTPTCSPQNQSRTIQVQKCSHPCNEMVGTAGWKLANSPWNLQVIARSPGSLTRFMPDDIPGVTSPMVYIGMLFSWFAWHVEDHELHSLNYLHMGSPKTWYAVPGTYAFTFEEVIRLHAYGENTDRLDALTRLGEKTTLLSPEVIVASGIPCCRLIQNPGEFVVTFPRAYHVGFSHGFNCGEAANFATPEWLSVAKEAAVRRAAMNYLPMLSHQQLLYLLTMSFTSRVPRSLLPGARSSRLRDRQKEERELSVKKAFIEDILKENHLLTILLKKNPSYHVVIWDLDLLPSSIKQPEPCIKSDTTVMTADEKTQSQDYPTQDLYNQMNCYMDSLNDFYADDADDLLCDYQVDSGTLPCVACGILGFPFMAVVQPTEQASRDLLAEGQGLIQQMGTLEAVDSQSLGLSGRAGESSGDTRNPDGKNLHQASASAGLSQSTSSPVKDQFLVTGHSLSLQKAIESSANMPGKSWNLPIGYLRPRIFCLEHAIQTVDLLHSKGGADVLGLCHSDFQKIKAHAAVVAEELGCPFTYNEIPLDIASQEDLYLIDHATDDQEKDEPTQDWTSKLCISLQHCVKMRKDFKKVQHALSLDGLSVDAILGSNLWKWQSRRSRSKRNTDSPCLKKSSLSKQTKEVEESGVKANAEIAGKEDKPIIRYFRKKYRSGSCDLKGVTKTSVDTNSLPSRELAAGCAIPNRKLCDESENVVTGGEDAGNGPLQSNSLPSSMISAIQDEYQVAKNPSPLKDVDSLFTASPVAQSIQAPGHSTSSQLVEKPHEDDYSTLHHFEELSETQVAEESLLKNDTADPKNSAASADPFICSSEDTMISSENKMTTEINGASRSEDVVQTGEPRKYCKTQAKGDDVIREFSCPGNSCSTVHDTEEASVSAHHAHTQTRVADGHGTIGLSKSSTLDGKVQEVQPITGDGQEVSVSSSAPVTNKIHTQADSHEEHHGIRDSISSLENQDLDENISNPALSRPNAKTGRKRKREVNMLTEDDQNFGGFIRSPCEGLRPRARRNSSENLLDLEKPIKGKIADRVVSKGLAAPPNDKKDQQKKGSYRCDIESCQMSFQTKTELATHKRNRCHVEGCGKKFNSHKYAILHQRVHDDDRPLKCTWKGCKMTFKWAWARTEHLRVHTGERPYKCKVDGCSLTFRFVSDFSRHRRKTGHYVLPNQQKCPQGL